MKDDVSICQKCFCMTHTRLGMCWKCHADKPSKTEQPVGDRALAIATERIESKKAHPESLKEQEWKGNECPTCKKLNWNCICWDKKRMRYFKRSLSGLTKGVEEMTKINAICDRCKRKVAGRMLFLRTIHLGRSEHLYQTICFDCAHSRNRIEVGNSEVLTEVWIA